MDNLELSNQINNKEEPQPKKKGFFEKINSLPKVKRYGVYSLTVVLLLGVGMGAAFGISRLTGREDKNPFNIISRSVKDKKETKSVPNPISGILVTPTEAQSWEKRLPLAVVVENIVAARPQSGLSKADLVYESLAEGGITRFLAIFLSQDTEVGPVRSARAYHIDWLSEYQAGFGHWGGSPEAMELIHEYSIKDLDQFTLDFPTYYRVSDRPAPHNGYTKTQNLWKAAEDRSWDSLPKIDSWKFKDDEGTPSVEVRNIKVRFGIDEDYFVDWKFDSEKKVYQRSVGGAFHEDKLNNEQLSAKNVVVQFADTYLKGGEGRLRIDSVGRGEAKIFRDGKVIDGSWRKSSRESRTHFYDKDGIEIEFNRGMTWIQILPSSEGEVKGGGIEYSS